ncbi:hypothetical protein HPB50_013429 [Hyalomma asiaticum]|uniref:Uncharacterized protein n=1 Tax=Hyalomma asiaticum TaxID=266040 RepID=A0ACB7STW8_HYAAI|nr:hypothetical protein HPB50_013429 [Hyalomma asiaticum]
MPPKQNVHELSPSGSSSPAETARASAEGSVFSQDGDDLLGGVREDAGSLAPSAVVELPDRGGAGQDRDDDAGSSASEATAVAAGLPGNLGGRIRERVREIENELSRFLSEGAALALQGQLVETRREVAVLQRRVHEAESGLPGAVAADLSARRADAPGPVPAAPQGALSYAAVLAGPGAAAGGPRLPGREPAGEVIPEVRQEQHQHVAFLTPKSQTAAPARDVLRLLKTNIDPASKGIKDVTLRHTRYRLTVFSNREESIKNMQQAIQENTVTRQMIIVRVPGRRNPHVRFSGVDPDVDSDRFFAMLNERNAGLALNEEHCKVRITFRERSGTPARQEPEGEAMAEGAQGSDEGGGQPGESRRTRSGNGGGRDGGSGPVAVHFIQVNLDHARLATGNLCDRMVEAEIPMAAVSDPYRPKGKLPRLPKGFQWIAAENNPLAAVIVSRAPFDVCPLVTTELVVAIYCEARNFSFTFVSAYAPPHKSMEPTLADIETALKASSSPNVIVAGDFNAKHSSLPTYETKYSMSWIDITLAAPSVIAGGYSWRVRDDVTHSEHRYIEVTVGDSPTEKRRRLTRFAREELVLSLGGDPWFAQVTGTELRSAEALDVVVDKFYVVYSRHLENSVRPLRGVARRNPWWSPQLAQERRRVNAMRRRFQRSRDIDLRAIHGARYSAALARFRRNIAQAKDAYLRAFCAENTRKCAFSEPYREAFGRTRTELVLPPLLRADGSRTASHLESAALLLRTQVAVDDPATDDEDHRLVREGASLPYTAAIADVPFTLLELRSVTKQIRERSAPGPDGITLPVLKGLETCAEVLRRVEA